MSEKHLSTQFDSELTSVSSQVMELGGLVESQIRQAIYALSQFSVEVANEVTAREARVNAMEIEIDRDLSSIIARRQPTARDLRLLIAISKTTGNLERVGDEAARIARHPDGDLVVTDRWGREDRFAAVLVTTQSWLLTTQIAVEESLFSHKMWMALDRTRYMQSSKTFVMVDRPFWKDKDPETGRDVMSMTLTDRLTRGTYLFDNGPDKPAVICLSYAWMGDALKMLPQTPEKRVKLALQALKKIYPKVDIASHIIGDPICVSWEADPYFLGAFKGALPGHYRYNQRMYAHFKQDQLPQQQRGIFIAGDDVSWTPAWVEGAVQTSLNAVWGIVQHLGGHTHAANPGPGDVFDTLGPIALPE